MRYKIANSLFWSNSSSWLLTAASASFFCVRSKSICRSRCFSCNCQQHTATLYCRRSLLLLHLLQLFATLLQLSATHSNTVLQTFTETMSRVFGSEMICVEWDVTTYHSMQLLATQSKTLYSNCMYGTFRSKLGLQTSSCSGLLRASDGGDRTVMRDNMPEVDTQLIYNVILPLFKPSLQYSLVPAPSSRGLIGTVAIRMASAVNLRRGSLFHLLTFSVPFLTCWPVNLRTGSAHGEQYLLEAT